MVTNVDRLHSLSEGNNVPVWDPVVRIFHWSLIAAFIVAYTTEGEALAVHVWAGYAVGGLLVLRVIWGFVGSAHARFSDFVYGPSKTLGYLRDLVRFRAGRYLGHSPAGGAMVIALLLSLSALVGTGLVTHAIRNNAGPLAGIVTAQASSIGTAAASSELTYPEQARGKPPRARKPGRVWKEAHEMFANIVLVLAGFHICGVLFSSIAHRENLVRAMITGRKRAAP